MKIFSKKKHKKGFNRFIDDLQIKIDEKEVEEYNDYIVELIRNPKNCGIPSDKGIWVSQAFTGPCGDTMKLFLKIKDGIIEKANFVTDGCGASIATANQTTQLIEGKSLDYAEKLKPIDIDEALKGLPEDHKHCAELAIKTLRRLINKYKDKI